jgi:uroporphyrinogen decarboxylase
MHPEGGTAMNSRDRVLTTVSRRTPDRVPVYFWLAPHIVERLQSERGVTNPEEYLHMDMRMVDYVAQPEQQDRSAYTKAFPPNTTINDWGCGSYPVGYYHFTKAVCPMAGFTSADQVEAYPFPERLPDMQALRSRVKQIQDQGFAAVSQYECGVFEQANGLMGMEKFLAVMYTDPAMARLLFGRISDVKARIAEAYVEAGVDVLFIGDDIGIQNGPIMPPAMWREYLIPPLKKIIERARAVRPGIPIAYHSCGMVGWAVEGLIEAGITILQSVQPEANDAAALKREYGDRLAFWGCIGSQSTMSHGTPGEVRAEVRHMIRTVGEGGGFICSPAHFVEPESPLENLDAFMETIEEFGYY